MGVDYYGVLELTSSATDDDFKKAYRRLALRYHPLRCNDDYAYKRFALISEAYDVLTNPETKAIYDQYGECGLKLGVPIWAEGAEGAVVKNYSFHGDTEKVFRDFFGVDNPYAEYFIPNNEKMGKYLGPEGKMTQLVPDPTHIIEVELEELFSGCFRRLVYERKVLNEDGVTMRSETKNLSIQIPPGCPSGRKFTYRGHGHQNLNSAYGDVVVLIKQKPHKLYIREGNDLCVDTKVPLMDALTGFKTNLDTLDGTSLSIAIPEIIKPGTRKILKGKGMPNEENRRERGDLIINFQVVFPEYLTKIQKEIIRKGFLHKSEDN
ncbi:dnaJ homolog subfamily B member 1-like [Centruroides sculpturatus]|uniref:dnaJ homolog subfamily B member 1-like n=1 Tax=Centruroides sculpturatus TaxID=218467 RepID=UPI000C6E0A35|nr:dnaJ homolog subfamily B member 1-like [Centruroides sculpturatus]XP_023239710.1 dnaJ homolog subfamily B member 1-like [Centruroides sculpturatus]